MAEKNYETPTLSITKISEKDILSGSDVLIDGSGLFDEQN